MASSSDEQLDALRSREQRCADAATNHAKAVSERKLRRDLQADADSKVDGMFWPTFIHLYQRHQAFLSAIGIK